MNKENIEHPTSNIQHRTNYSVEEGERETKRWLRLVARIPALPAHAVDPLLGETVELIRIFAASIRTAEKRSEQTTKRKQ
jgi:hypothetical protein